MPFKHNVLVVVDDVALGVNQVPVSVHFDTVVILEGVIWALGKKRLTLWRFLESTLHHRQVEFREWENLGEFSVFQFKF